jgi:hypothetical protein
MAHIINGPDCGRDKEGNFVCVCGKCREIPTASEVSSEQRQSSDKASGLKLLFLRLRTKYMMLKNPFKIFLYEKNGKRYLVAFYTTFKGVKWLRRFEIVSELDASTFEPIEFKGIRIDDRSEWSPIG